ncbi:MAG TPA: YraN family protein [Acetivibrio sp.]|uniref:YraN family protein n=1 Tax=Acetivibrio sp. TaxID=1872092 RepID=UPI002D0FAA57|nr:YraN family protein [Acetivibrio sp.]HOM02734.1 YraN family protein [Acetivibrio sp.]
MNGKVNNKKAAGTIGEDAAVEYLKENNFEILERNFRFKRLGEIDIISREKDYICFVEVKSRSTFQYGYPREAVNLRKQENIRRLAQIYLCKNGLNDLKVRFDVIEVYMEKKGDDIEVKEISLLKNAF